MKPTCYAVCPTQSPQLQIIYSLKFTNSYSLFESAVVYTGKPLYWITFKFLWTCAKLLFMSVKCRCVLKRCFLLVLWHRACYYYSLFQEILICSVNVLCCDLCINNKDFILYDSLSSLHHEELQARSPGAVWCLVGPCGTEIKSEKSKSKYSI